MKINLISSLSLVLLAGVNIVSAQVTPPAAKGTAALAPESRPRRPVEQPDPNAPATKYDYHDAFAPFFYTKN